MAKRTRRNSPRRRSKARRASTRRRSKSLKRSGRIRPVVIVSGGGYHRPKKSKYFKGRTVINRRRSKSKRRYSRRPMRMNPFNVGSIKRILELRNIFHYLSIGGGILAGAFLTRFFTTGNVPFAAPGTPPAWASPTSWWGKLRPAHGLIHVILGSMAASKAKNPYIKDAGIGMASIGGYDLLTQLLTLAGMTGIPTLSGMDVSVYGMNYDRPRGVLGGRAGILSNASSGIMLGADDRGSMTMAEEIQSHIMGGM